MGRSLRHHSTLAAIGPCALLLTVVSEATAADVVKTNPLPVYMHYMPWFETPDTLGGNQWGYHWRFNNQDPNVVDATGRRQIAAHYYPKIGPYASRDPDVIEYHLLLMKYAGVDGVLIDWYGVQGTNGDINLLLDSSNAIVDHVDDFGLDFGVVLEDRFSANIGQAQANVAYLRDNYFNRPEYIRLGPDQDPLLPVFGPITFNQPSDWASILTQAGEPVDLLPLWYQGSDAGSNAGGEYAWIFEDEQTDDHLTRQLDFLQTRAQQIQNSGAVAGGVAYPGFDDFYVEGGVGEVVAFDIPHEGGATLEAVLDQVAANSGNLDFLQLATFNDFGEGTIFEPTIETGYEYLEQVQDYTGVPYGVEELELVYRLYVARKRYEDNALANQLLDGVAAALADLDVTQAINLLDFVAPLGDFNGDGFVDAGDEAVWRQEFGSQTVFHGSGADGNFDGVVDASDYTVWRDSLSAFDSTATSVPEAAGASLAGIAAALAAQRAARNRHVEPASDSTSKTEQP